MSLDRKPIITDAVRAKIRKQHPREGKKLQVKKRVMGKWRTHPVDKMVKIANFIEASNPELAAKIWMRLLDSCELEEKAKKTFIPIPVDDIRVEPDFDKLLNDLEGNKTDGNIKAGSDTSSMASGSSLLQVETSPEEDLRRNKPE